jgi:hypothetical protein
MRATLRLLAAVVIGLLLLVPLAAVYEAAALPVYHSWGLIHGSFATAIPALVLAGFVALGLIPWFGRGEDALPRMMSCGSVLALVTARFYVDRRSDYALSVWHFVLYASLFAAFVLLCWRAKRPFLVPLFFLCPLLVDPVLGLLLTARDSPYALWMFGYDLLHQLLPAAVATGLAAAVAIHIRAREE